MAVDTIIKQENLTQVGGTNFVLGQQSAAASLPVVLPTAGTYAIYFDQSAPTVKAIPSTGTFIVGFDPGHELGSIKGINNSIAVVPFTPAGTAITDEGHDAIRALIVGTSAAASLAISGTLTGITNTLAVYFDRANPNVLANAGTGSFNVQFDPGHTLGKVDAGTGTFQIFIPDTGHELGSIRGINSSIGVYFDRGNPTVTANAGTGSFTVQFDPGHTLGNIATVTSITNTVNVAFSPASPSVKETRPTTSSVTNVASSGTSVQLLASNTSRLTALFYNDSTQAAYIRYASTSAVDSYTVKVYGNGYHEISQPAYTGAIAAIWDAANGTMRITELT